MQPDRPVTPTPIHITTIQQAAPQPMSPEPSVLWPICSFICCWPIGIATCCQYCSLSTARASGNNAAYDSAVNSMKCTAKAAISIGVILTILWTLYIVFFLDTVGDIFEGSYDYHDNNNPFGNDNMFGNIFNDINQHIDNAIDQHNNNPFGWKSEEQ